MSRTPPTYEEVLAAAKDLREQIEYLGYATPEGTDLCDKLILLLEVATARAENYRLRQDLEDKEAADAEAAALEARNRRHRDQKVVKTVHVFGGGLHNVEVAPGKSVRLWGTETNHVNGPVEYDRVFEIGDTAEYGSYNLIYLGQITNIGAKTVTIEDHGTRRRLKLEEFSWRNRMLDLDKIAEQNQDTLMCI